MVNGYVIITSKDLYWKDTSVYVSLFVPLAAITSPRERMAPHIPNDPYVIKVWSLEANTQRSKPTKSSSFTVLIRYSSANLTSLYLAKFSWKSCRNECFKSSLYLYPRIIIADSQEHNLIFIIVVTRSKK